MEEFEEFLKQSTVRGANKVPGAVMAVVHKDGNAAGFISPSTR
jgi:hypothetical protein